MAAGTGGALCVAPMMGHSHRAGRRLWRMLNAGALLYTEMLPAAALVTKVRAKHKHEPEQGKVALQVAGSDCKTLAEACRIGEGLGYCEINLNCGCPSTRATAGGFGACMMLNPNHAARCVAAMVGATRLPVSVKCRIAVDDGDPQECLFGFAEKVAAAGCKKIIVHARKALLQGISAKDNRSRPPLCPSAVPSLKRSFPHVEVVGNGGIVSVDSAQERLQGTDGVMMGRAIVARPALLSEFAEKWSGAPRVNIVDILGSYLDYAASSLGKGVSPSLLLQPLFHLAQGRPGARRFRQALHGATMSMDIGEVMAAWP